MQIIGLFSVEHLLMATNSDSSVGNFCSNSIQTFSQEKAILSQCFVRIVSVLLEQIWSISEFTFLAKAVTISSEKVVTTDFAIDG